MKVKRLNKHKWKNYNLLQNKKQNKKFIPKKILITFLKNFVLLNKKTFQNNKNSQNKWKQ